MKRGFAFFVLLLCILVVAAKFCQNTERLKLEGHVELHSHNGSIMHNNVEYPEGTHWKDGNNIYGCPCKIKNCIRLCSEAFALDNKLAVPDKDFELQVWNDEQPKSVKLYNHFTSINESSCKHSMRLDPDEYRTDSFNILANGSLHFINSSRPPLVIGSNDYCIVKNKNESTVVVFSCIADDDQTRGIVFYLYLVFMLVSIIFLLLTVVAFFIAPEMQNLHGKCITCQSGSLMIAFVALTVIYLEGSNISQTVCKVFAYLLYTFLLISFFWLNSMCFDIIWTFRDFKNMTESRQMTHKKRFRYYALYSTINPLILTALVKIFDEVLDGTSSIWPGIGIEKCWFIDHTAEFLFYQGPTLLLLIANIIFFTFTVYKILKIKRETAVLKKGDSKTHSGTNGGKEDKERLVLYVKLFLLMGGTWLMDIISWGVGGPAWIWILPDLINCSRGIFIFYFCVWSNKKVRNSLLRRVCSKYASKFGVNDASKSYNFKTINGSEPPNFHCDSTQVTLNAKYQENDTAV